MSKMPAKKKSCFQITSVTQAAQVAASSITDDTESLDDPDESRTEDVSSEIFDVSRADFDPGVCDRSSSEETLNNVGEVEAAVMALHIPQESVAATGPFNGGHAFMSHVSPHALSGTVPVPALSQPSIPTLVSLQPTTVNAGPVAEVSPSVSQSQPAAPSTSATAATTSCSSRFRVIKLDHGSGEPFRRGRWTCTEFYERDSEGSSMSRTVDSIKHAITLDHNVDRESGLVGNVSAMIQESAGDSGYSTIHLAPQVGSATSAFQPTLYSAALSQVNVQPAVPQTLHTGGLNGSPQQFAYTDHPSGTPPSQLDYRQQHVPPIQCSSAPTLPMASLSGGPPSSQGPSPVITPSGPAVKGSGLVVGSLAGGTLAPGAMAVPLLPGGTPLHHGSQPHPSGGEADVPTTSAAPFVPNTHPAGPSTNNTPPGMPSGALVGSSGQSTATQADDSRRRSDTLPQPNTTPGKDTMRPFVPESLHLATPTVNSLFGIAIPMDVMDEDGSSGASVVAIDNKIEQAMDLVKSHLMYAVREEVEVLKEQIKELYERNSQLERENAVLKSLANTEQLTQLSTNQMSPGSTSPPQQMGVNTPLEGAAQVLGLPQQPNVTSA
ncbi:hypothetical protein UPYG_G00039450 [Umbra pygmaea]|uniref:TSC22 domain family protein 2 n=1 Tax=Umbra pygmaea TaxID=75934 RepID=A0ABD0Y596_UMBPY